MVQYSDNVVCDSLDITQELLKRYGSQKLRAARLPLLDNNCSGLRKLAIDCPGAPPAAAAVRAELANFVYRDICEAYFQVCAIIYICRSLGTKYYALKS